MTSVDITDTGKLVLTTEAGVTLVPITIADAKALAAAIPQAQNALDRVSMTQSIRALTDMLVVQGDGMSAHVQVSSTAVTASVDPATFTAAQEQLGVTPDSAGALVLGPVTVTTPASPTPTPTTGTA